MKVSVVVPTYNQKERLRLVLAGLTVQASRLGCQVIVVDDGSSDGTREMLDSRPAEIETVLLSDNRGRAAARNEGAKRALGDLVIFLDGDALPAPDLVETYMLASAQAGEKAVLCGLQYCLPDTEYVQDPSTGSLIDIALASVVRDFLDAHLRDKAITEAMIRTDFGRIETQAVEGAYPFPELGVLQEQTRSMLHRDGDFCVRWLGFVPHNGAVPRSLGEHAGWFDTQMPFMEGWELAYRLQRLGAEFCAVNARSYHLYHHRDTSTPSAAMEETQMRYRAIEYMVRKHRDARLRLLYFWLAHLWLDELIPESARIGSLGELDSLYKHLGNAEWADYEVLLRNYPLWPIAGIPGER